MTTQNISSMQQAPFACQCMMWRLSAVPQPKIKNIYEFTHYLLTIFGGEVPIE